MFLDDFLFLVSQFIYVGRFVVLNKSDGQLDQNFYNYRPITTRMRISRLNSFVDRLRKMIYLSFYPIYRLRKNR